MQDPHDACEALDRLFDVIRREAASKAKPRSSSFMWAGATRKLAERRLRRNSLYWRRLAFQGDLQRLTALFFFLELSLIGDQLRAKLVFRVCHLGA